MKHSRNRAWYELSSQETHAFDQDPKNDFVCSKCGKPRALHKDSPQQEEDEVSPEPTPVPLEIVKELPPE